MRVADLAGMRVAIWGLGREGRAAIRLIRRQHPEMPLLLLDDDADARLPAEADAGCEGAFGSAAVARALGRVDVVVKSPGVSLYRPELQSAPPPVVTSLLNLWFAEKPPLATLCVTGTKGKSTTAALAAHMLSALGRRTALVGNIGTAISEIDAGGAEVAVIEMSSYQAADFTGQCDVAALTSLYPEHLDWHGSPEAYFRDKLRLLRHGRTAVIDTAAAPAVARILGALPQGCRLFGDEREIHARDGAIFDGAARLGDIGNPYLARRHNRSNLCAALTALQCFGVDPGGSLAAARDFRGLPHRQQELGEVDGVLFVDDSISTIPESTIAALEAYRGRDITVILGGYDRGIDYAKLVEAVAAGAAKAVICLGRSGERIRRQIEEAGAAATCRAAASMAEAVAAAKRLTAPGGVVLLSPAAPSYGDYRDFIERGRDFAEKTGLSAAGMERS
jgi:UDP-N-acetylmuramoyl-L-alanine---L-glutamate ligase